jgi:hypothetical protein
MLSNDHWREEMSNLTDKQTRAGERGAISIKALLVLVFVGVTALVVIKITPVYIEQTRVIHDVSEMGNKAAVRNWKEDRINSEIKLIQKEYDLPEGGITFVTRDEKGVHLNIAYQRNIDLFVTTYEWKVDLPVVKKDTL